MVGGGATVVGGVVVGGTVVGGRVVRPEVGETGGEVPSQEKTEGPGMT